MFRMIICLRTWSFHHMCNSARLHTTNPPWEPGLRCSVAQQIQSKSISSHKPHFQVTIGHWAIAYPKCCNSAANNPGWREYERRCCAKSRQWAIDAIALHQPNACPLQSLSWEWQLHGGKTYGRSQPSTGGETNRHTFFQQLFKIPWLGARDWTWPNHRSN